MPSQPSINPLLRRFARLIARGAGAVERRARRFADDAPEPLWKAALDDDPSAAPCVEDDGVRVLILTPGDLEDLKGGQSASHPTSDTSASEGEAVTDTTAGRPGPFVAAEVALSPMDGSLEPIDRRAIRLFPCADALARFVDGRPFLLSGRRSLTEEIQPRLDPRLRPLLSDRSATFLDRLCPFIDTTQPIGLRALLESDAIGLALPEDARRIDARDALLWTHQGASILTAREWRTRRRHEAEWTGSVRNATPPMALFVCFEATETLISRETARSRVSLRRLHESGVRGDRAPPVSVPHLLRWDEIAAAAAERIEEDDPTEVHVVVHHHAEFACPTLPVDRLAALGIVEAGVASRSLSTALQIDHGARILLRLLPNGRLWILPLQIVFQGTDPRSGRRCVVWAFAPTHNAIGADRLLDFHRLSERTPHDIRRALIEAFVERINPALGGAYLVNPWSWWSGVERGSDRERLQRLLRLFAAADPELRASLPIDLEITLPAHPGLASAHCARQSIVAHGAPLTRAARDRLVFLVNMAAEDVKSWGARPSMEDDPMPFLRATRRKARRRLSVHVEGPFTGHETLEAADALADWYKRRRQPRHDRWIRMAPDGAALSADAVAELDSRLL